MARYLCGDELLSDKGHEGDIKVISKQGGSMSAQPALRVTHQLADDAVEDGGSLRVETTP